MVAAAFLQSSLLHAQMVEQRVESLDRDSLDMMEDSLAVETDSIAALADSASMAQQQNKSGLTAVVNYKASDALVFSMGNMA